MAENPTAPGNISDLLKVMQSKIELPSSFPSIVDWVMVSWGDVSDSTFPCIAILGKVTSGNPENGTVSGLLFFDPGLVLLDSNQERLELPPVLPFLSFPYSKSGNKMTWMHVADYRTKLLKEQAKARS